MSYLGLVLMITLSLQTVLFFPCLLVWHKFLLKTGHVVLDNRQLVKWTLSIWLCIYLADRCVGLLYTLDVGARNFIFLCYLLFCLCCELWISPSTCFQSENASWSYVIYNPESSLTLLFFSYTHQTCQNIILASSRTYMQSDIPCEYLSVITNIYLYFCNNFLTGSTTFFPLSFEADIYLPSGLLSALRLTSLCLRILNWLTLCCPLGSTWQRSLEWSQWERGQCRGLLVS